MQNEKLIHRLNRITGQIEGIKRKLESEEDADCVQTLQQLKASINGLKKFGEAYMNTHMEKCLAQGIETQKVKETLKEVLAGAFSL